MATAVQLRQPGTVSAVMDGGALAGVGAEVWAGDAAGVGAEVWAAWAGEVDIAAGAESISKWRTEFVPSATFLTSGPQSTAPCRV